MKKKNVLKFLFTALIVASVLLNLVFLFGNLYTKVQQKIYNAAYNDTISVMFNKAKQAGYIELVLDGEKLLLTVTQNEEN